MLPSKYTLDLYFSAIFLLFVLMCVFPIAVNTSQGPRAARSERGQRSGGGDGQQQAVQSAPGRHRGPRPPLFAEARRRAAAAQEPRHGAGRHHPGVVLSHSLLFTCRRSLVSFQGCTFTSILSLHYYPSINNTFFFFLPLHLRFWWTLTPT